MSMQDHSLLATMVLLRIESAAITAAGVSLESFTGLAL
jgi:hypothetical protein